MYNIVSETGQSPPLQPGVLDLTSASSPIDTSHLADKTILITGGASGFGAAFARRWAAAGANLMIGDVDDSRGEALAAELRGICDAMRKPQQQKQQQQHHFFHCDVTSWSSQVQFFRSAAEASPHGGIDVVVANAGCRETDPDFMDPKTDYSRGYGGDEALPPPPSTTCLDVNVTGVMYTTHLALWWLPRNPGSVSMASQQGKPQNRGVRDRHLLLIGSVASFFAVGPQPQYTASKHAVLGLFRTLRMSCAMGPAGVRCNMVNPYYVRTGIVGSVGEALLAGGGMGELEEVVDAATKLMADPTVVGRAVATGPRVTVKEGEGGDELEVLAMGRGGQGERGAWEVLAHDFEYVDVFNYRFVRMLGRVQEIRGWIGWLRDWVRIFWP